MTARSYRWIRISLPVLYLLGFSPWALAGVAPDNTSTAETWVTWQQELTDPIPWAYSFGLRHRDQQAMDSQHRRVLAEIELLGQTLSVIGQPHMAQALEAWSRSLREIQPTLHHSRSAERMDLPWLMADLRRDPNPEDLAHIGFCQPPDWIELWSMEGVDRIDWTHDLTLQKALSTLPRTGVRGADHATLITPLGQIREFGIAAWNREDTALAPGSRIMVQLPTRNLGETFEGHQVNQRLPRILATRLPGDDCRLQSLP